MRHFEFRCPVVVLHVMLALVCSASPSAADERPSNLLVVADDMGWTDLGCIGSEIDTRSHRPKTETIESFRMRRVSGQPSMQLAVLRNVKMPIAPNQGRAVGFSRDSS
jgi:hypothetical protein